MEEKVGTQIEAVSRIAEVLEGVNEHLKMRESNVYLANLTDAINEIKKLVFDHNLEIEVQMEALGAIYDALVERGFHDTAAELATQYEL